MPLMPKCAAVFVLTIISHFVFSQTNWQDTFSDSNFTHSPTWVGDTGSFRVNGQKELQLDAAPVSSTKYLSTPSTCGIEATWEFWLQMDFNPSSNNFASVHLMSSDDHANTGSTGYFLRIGGSSADKISLFRKDGGNTSLVLESNSGLLNTSSVNAHIKVNRNAQHQWQLLVDTTGGTNFALKATGTDSTYLNSAFFILECIFTSTRSTKFYFDDIVVSGKAFLDDVPPTIVSNSFPSNKQIALQFSEPIDSATAVKPGNFLINQGQNPVLGSTWSAQLPQTVVIERQSIFQNNSPVQLFVEGIEDRYANEMEDTTFTLEFFRPQYRDVVFNEIMADPEPGVNLPALEYLEIANNTQRFLAISGWKLVADEDTFLMADFSLSPNEKQLIVSTANQGEYDSLQPLEIAAGSSWLKNGGETLLLLDNANLVIDALSYSSSWHQNMAKADGGWSLEQIDPALPCSDHTNWNSSKSLNGGTPSLLNDPETRLFPTNTFANAVKWIGNDAIELQFSSAITPRFPLLISSTASIDSIVLNPEKPSSAIIQFQSTISGQEFIFIDASQNCFGDIQPDTIPFSPPQTAEKDDLVLNEILFNASEDNAEFIEIWNTSDKTILLSELLLVKYQDGNPTESVPLSEEDFLFLPKTFMVFTDNPIAVCENFHCGKSRFYVEHQDLPSLPNDGGEIGLTNRAMQELERVQYDEEWHHPSVSNAQNVSLERIHPDLPVEFSSSWHSASSSSGYATPGQMNSQFRSTATGQDQIWLATKTISPNNDGLNDVLIIQYELPEGAVLNAHIFALNGVKVMTIARNELSAPTGHLVWNGAGENGEIPQTGAYIILVEWFTPDGQKGATKLNFALQK